MSAGRKQGVEYSECLREETVVVSDGGVGTDAPVTSARWQEDERSTLGVEGVICNAGSFVDVANAVRRISDGR